MAKPCAWCWRARTRTLGRSWVWSARAAWAKSTTGTLRSSVADGECALADAGHDKAALAQFPHRAADCLVSDAPLVGQVPLSGQLLARRQLPRGDQAGHVVGRLLE